MEIRSKLLVLSALLHDIGKFCQRVGRPYSTHLEGEYTEVIGGKVRFLHTLYTYYFIENDLPLPKELENYRSMITRIASAHHHPNENNLEEMSIMIADRLSSTRGRIDYPRSESKNRVKKSRLASVFDTIELAEHQFAPPGSWFHNLAPLGAADETIFPRKGYPEGESEEYQDLFRKFSNELNEFDHDRPFALFFDGLVSLLEKYTWCVPSSTRNTSPDVSLFDHSTSTAGIAQSLFMFHVSNGGIPHFDDEVKKFILLAGDLSGIQDYIFSTSKSNIRGASKIFRAGSFFLQALIRSVILNVQERFNLLSVCRIMDLGGKFILLLPHLNHVLEGLDELDNEVQNWFRRRFKGRLTLSLDWSARLSQQDFFCDSFQGKLDLANDKLEAAGAKKPAKIFAGHSQIIENNYNEFEDGNCALCGMNRADAVTSKEYARMEKVNVKVCADCGARITYLGPRIPKTNYLIYKSTGGIPLFGGLCLFLEKEVPTDFNDVRHVDALVDGHGFHRVRPAGRLPRIDQLGDDKLMGRPLLGFLKVDVDNLCLLFSRGLDNRLSIARFCTMSRMLNLFFSDYLVHLAEREFPGIYIIYAGGDGLFSIGPWNQMVEFDVTLRKKLDAFCCRNEDITLSAGMLVTNPGLPMRPAAGLVESALEAAKGYKDSNRVKNSFCFLGETVSWEEPASLPEPGLKLDKAS
ncbi:MAG: type III-A CRISPR-associated protein Cas10/Csm1 [Deltaproteobacteria bacterium]|nr:type III-A CRISPR-associated protein Cas10/Csm1 [Deltaproteobacteria bacterium]MBF0525703.1 type III-A CRISPR-associated protein Cas10/Csm1 [Deltaproteobacteria bacterium]